jgi:membrane-associated phospholipid phosphatase
MKFLATAISKVINPLFTTVAAFAMVILVQELSVQDKITWFLLAGLAAGIPLSIFYVDYRSGRIASFWSPSGKERTRAFLVWFISGLALSGVAFFLAAPRLITAFALVFAALGLLNLTLAGNSKISIHMEGVTALALTGLLAVGTSLFFLIALIPLVGWSRLYLKAHTLSEVIYGAFASVIAIYLVFSFFGLATF